MRCLGHEKEKPNAKIVRAEALFSPAAAEGRILKLPPLRRRPEFLPVSVAAGFIKGAEVSESAFGPKLAGPFEAAHRSSAPMPGLSTAEGKKLCRSGRLPVVIFLPAVCGSILDPRPTLPFRCRLTIGARSPL